MGKGGPTRRSTPQRTRRSTFVERRVCRSVRSTPPMFCPFFGATFAFFLCISAYIYIYIAFIDLVINWKADKKFSECSLLLNSNIRKSKNHIILLNASHYQYFPTLGQWLFGVLVLKRYNALKSKKVNCVMCKKSVLKKHCVSEKAIAFLKNPLWQFHSENFTL